MVNCSSPIPPVSGNPECVLLLLQAGANPSSPDNQGAHPLHYAAQSARDAAPPLARWAGQRGWGMVDECG